MSTPSRQIKNVPASVPLIPDFVVVDIGTELKRLKLRVCGAHLIIEAQLQALRANGLWTGSMHDDEKSRD